MSVEVRKSSFGKYAKDYATYRAGFPRTFFEKLSATGIIKPDLNILDLGTGTGTLARWFAKQSLNVTGLDFDAQMIEASKELDQKEKVKIEYMEASANEIPCDSDSFDLISAGQCWHWFNHEKVCHEVNRLLRPSGKLLVAYFDWIGRKGNPVDLMYELKPKYIEEEMDHQRKWPLGFYPQSPEELNFPKMKLSYSELWEEDVHYTFESWLGRLRAYNGLGGRLDADQMTTFESEYSTLLQDRFPEDVLNIPHKVWYGVWEIGG